MGVLNLNVRTPSQASQIPFGDVTNGQDGRASLAQLFALFDGLTQDQKYVLASLIGGEVSNVQYDGQDRIISMVKTVPGFGATTITIDYSTPNVAIITNSSGEIRTVAVDGDGRVTGII